MHNHVEVVFIILTEKLIVTLCQMEREIKEIRDKTIRSCKIKMSNERNKIQCIRK